MGVPDINKEKFGALSAIVRKSTKSTGKPQMLKVREACGGCWAVGKSQDRSEKSREKYRRRQKWAKHEDGGFRWKI